MRSLHRIFLIAGVAALGLAEPAVAHGGYWGGWGIGIGLPGFWGWGWPGYYPPPVYYPPPPVYYAPPAPPPGYYAPYPGYIAQLPPNIAPPASSSATAQSCNAGNYICPMEATVPPGGRCYCPDNNGGRAYGTAQ